MRKGSGLELRAISNWTDLSHLSLLALQGWQFIALRGLFVLSGASVDISDMICDATVSESRTIAVAHTGISMRSAQGIPLLVSLPVTWQSRAPATKLRNFRETQRTLSATVSYSLKAMSQVRSHTKM